MARKLIALYGAPGTGVTTIAAKLACQLARQKCNSILILASDLYSALPLISANYDPNRSLGKLLDSNITDYLKTTSQSLLDQMQKTRLPHLGIYSYGVGENRNDYAKYESYIAEAFLDRLFALDDIDYIIVDCASDFHHSRLSETALLRADVVFQICNPSVKSLSYGHSQRKHLLEKSSVFSDIVVANHYMPNEPLDAFEMKLGQKIQFHIERNIQIYQQYMDGDLLVDLSSLSKSNQKVLKEFARMMQLIEEQRKEDMPIHEGD